MNYFVQWIYKYEGVVNYDTAYSETAHKYFLKVYNIIVIKEGWKKPKQITLSALDKNSTLLAKVS